MEERRDDAEAGRKDGPSYSALPVAQEGEREAATPKVTPLPRWPSSTAEELIDVPAALVRREDAPAQAHPVATSLPTTGPTAPVPMTELPSSTPVAERMTWPFPGGDEVEPPTALAPVAVAEQPAKAPAVQPLPAWVGPNHEEARDHGFTGIMPAAAPGSTPSAPRPSEAGRPARTPTRPQPVTSAKGGRAPLPAWTGAVPDDVGMAAGGSELRRTVEPLPAAFSAADSVEIEPGTDLSRMSGVQPLPRGAFPALDDDAGAAADGYSSLGGPDVGGMIDGLTAAMKDLTAALRQGGETRERQPTPLHGPSRWGDR